MTLARVGVSIVALFAALIGLVWIGQGTGVFPYPASSFMINQTPWIINGLIAAIGGLIVILGSRRILH